MRSIRTLPLLLLPTTALAFSPSPRPLLRHHRHRPTSAPLRSSSPPDASSERNTIDQYSNSLSEGPSEQQRKYQSDAVRTESTIYSIIDTRPAWQSRLLRPVRYVSRAARAALPAAADGGGGGAKGKKNVKPGALILLRCGESEWTRSGRFTGWADVDLVGEGVLEIEHAGRLLLSEGYEPDMLYTSRLKRAVKSTWTILNTLSAPYLPVYKSWRLNERNYGALTGLKKMEVGMELGVEVVQAWRNSLKARPPPMKKTDPYYPGNDRRYEDLSEDQIPLTESLMDCMERARPLWDYGISKEIKKGNTVLVVAHTNTLRSLMQVIDNIGEEDIQEVSMPGGIPFVYKFDSDMNPLPPDQGKMSQAHTSGIFLEKPGLLKEALRRQKKWDATVPGSFGVTVEVTGAERVGTLEENLLKLKEEKAMEDTVVAGDNGDGNVNDSIVDPNDDGQLIVTTTMDSSSSSSGGHDALSKASAEDYDAEFEEFFARTPEAKIVPNIQKPTEQSPGIIKQGQSKDPVVVFIRHGRTPHNNLGLFTGWEDPPLAPDGVEDAKNAGRLLKLHGFEFDVVYTSWLTRAIETAWYTMDELDDAWLPMVKSWRLNERMYGALTGKSKQMIANEYGEAQLKKWRRGFKIQPPPVSSYSLSYPGNNYKRTKYVKDLRISLMETINRSIEAKEFQVHRKFPKAESLWDCMQRSIPFYTQRIVPEAVDKGKRVLITSHENAIRGILMHLCEIPEEAINQLSLPNGLPLVYNVKRKCITLLDDGSGKDPMETHDFGAAAQYLFRPCELDDDFFDEMEQQGLANQEASASKQEAV